MLNHHQLQRLQQVNHDVEALRNLGANVNVASGKDGLLSGFMSDFQGYPASVRKFFDTPDLESTNEFTDIVER